MPRSRWKRYVLCIITPELSKMSMAFEIIGVISDVETIATGRSIREFTELQARYGRGRWRQLKGFISRLT